MAEKAVAPGDLEQQIIARALKDPQFRDALIAHPRGALESMGVQLPEGIQVKVLQQEPNTLYLVVPRRPAALDTEAELTEAELGYLVGGGTTGCGAG